MSPPQEDASAGGLFHVTAWPLARCVKYASRPASAASHIAVAPQPRLQGSGRRNPQRLPSGPSWWRCVHRRVVVCSRPSIAAREAPRQLRTRRHSGGVDGKSREPSISSSVTPGARSRCMEEKGWNGIFDGHGLLAQAMVRNPPYAGGSGQLQGLYHAGA